MKGIISLAALFVLLAGCATNNPDGPHPGGAGYPPDNAHADPTYRGPGVYFGAGFGRWGGQRGAGAGFGLGF